MSASPTRPAPDGLPHLAELLAYLNLSSGTPDPRFQARLNELFAALAQREDADEAPWRMVGQVLSAELERLAGTGGPWSDVSQARGVLALSFDVVLPAYLEHHRDLLFHQTAEFLFQPLFLARVFEAVLAAHPLGTDQAAVVEQVIGSLNDFLGHRPVAVLHNDQRMEPYAHERVRPVPVYLREVGVGRGPYEELLTAALDILRATDRELLDEGCLDLDLLDELAVDPRAYDFEHPVNKRPNYHFGQWDPHLLDSQGRYRRFVLVQVTLDVLVSRFQSPGVRCRDQLVWESAAVLAGTMLMSSLMGGRSPETHDSTVSLANLLPRIARLRDRFYEFWMTRVGGSHGVALREEAGLLRQPFGGARQFLNHALARLRARQQQHVHLARMFARMGYPQASLRQAAVVPAASARMTAEIDCRIVAAHHAAERGQLPSAAALVPQIQDLLDRAIGCGALVDPWNILGFQGQFPIFTALENSVRDHRVDELIALVERIFGLYARLMEDSAAAGDEGLATRLERSLVALAGWWDQFATSQVSGVRRLSGAELSQAAIQVAQALGAWHRAGAAAGDLAFWRQHVAAFGSPKSYALVINALLEKNDFVASLALLVQWLCRADEIELADSEHSWHSLVLRWVRRVGRATAEQLPGEASAAASQRRWGLVRKLLDYIEANAEQFWHVPQFPEGLGIARSGPSGAAADAPSLADELETDELLGADDDTLGDDSERNDDLEFDADPSDPEGFESDDEDEEGDDEDDEPGEHLYRAAYENVVYRDSTQDGVEGDVLDDGSAGVPDDLWDYEGRRLEPWLALLTTVAQVWKTLAAWNLEEAPHDPAAAASSERVESLGAWGRLAERNLQDWLRLLEAIHRQGLSAPLGTREALIEYDRRRGIKQTLLERTVAGMVETVQAQRFLAAALPDAQPQRSAGAEDKLGVELIRRLFGGDRAGLRQQLPELLQAISQQRLLYLPLGKGGDPQELAATQSRLQLLRELAVGLPRLGLLSETRELLVTAQQAERINPVGEGAVTEFDRLFHLAYRGLVESLVESSRDWPAPRDRDPSSWCAADEDLVSFLQAATESLLVLWLDHSRSLRLSVLERVAGQARWQTLVGFVERYGHDLFTARFLGVGNLRAITDTGTAGWLAQLERNPPDDPPRLLDELGTQISLEDAARQLDIVISAVLENYAEYRDFNSTTTQSDRGELLYSFLDFLRLKSRYDRVSWNLKPVVLAHQVLERRGRSAAAQHWRRIVAERTAEAADWHWQRLEELQQKYGMKLPTISDRLAERFTRPLELDCIRALVRPAIEEQSQGQAGESFSQLEQKIAEFSRQPTGSGLDLPGWLLALELEVEQVRSGGDAGTDGTEAGLLIPAWRLSRSEVQSQLEGWPES